MPSTRSTMLSLNNKEKHSLKQKSSSLSAPSILYCVCLCLFVFLIASNNINDNDENHLGFLVAVVHVGAFSPIQIISSSSSMRSSSHFNYVHHEQKRNGGLTATHLRKNIFIDEDDYDYEEEQQEGNKDGSEESEDRNESDLEIESLWSLEDENQSENLNDDGSMCNKIIDDNKNQQHHIPIAKNDDINTAKRIQKVEPISSSSSDPSITYETVKARTTTNIIPQHFPSSSRRGVGRNSYNMTILHSINYDQTQYYEHFIKSSYDIRIDLLKDYHTIHGHINIPFRYTASVNDYDNNGEISTPYEIHLGRWLHWVRTLYKKDEEKMKEHNSKTTTIRSSNEVVRRKVPREYVEKLNELGMNWDGVGARRRPTNFRLKCDELKTFIDKYGHSYVPKDWAENKSLAMWVERQRFLYKRRLEGRQKGYQLTDERMDLLLSIGFDFNGRGQARSGNFKGSFGNKDEREKIEKLAPGWYDDQFPSYLDKDWWRKLDLLQQHKAANNTQTIMTEREMREMSLWILDQHRQYSLLYNNDMKTSRTTTKAYNSTTIKVNLKSLLTPKRYQALSDLNFSFGMNEETFPTTMLPWQDIAEINFNCEHMLDLLRKLKEQSRQCNISCDENMLTHMVLFDSDKSSSEYENFMLYLFQRRIRWERRHQSNRAKIPQIHWCLERKDVNIEENLNEIGFSWFDFDIPGNDNVWEREFEWWTNFHDLCRYKKANNGFTLNANEIWYSEELVDWLEEQSESYRIIKSDVDDVKVESYYFEEWHLQALYDVGFELNVQENNKGFHLNLMNNPMNVGRPPAILALEKDLEARYDELSSDLQQVVNKSLNTKRIDITEQLAWLVRYEALRRLYSANGPGALSVMSSDKDVGDKRLLLWADNQRKQYSNLMEGKKSALTKSRIKLLDDINFDWKLPSEDEEWNQMISALNSFKEEYGHCFVPAVYPKDTKLGQFVHLRRQQYQLSKRDDIISVALPSTLSDDRAHELINIGLDLTMNNLSFGNIAYEILWKCKVEELDEFKKLHGHCNVAFDYKSPYYDLALWVKEQRILYKRFKEGVPSQLDEKRIKDLDALAFSWEEEVHQDTL